jgi:hypothetical protein
VTAVKGRAMKKEGRSFWGGLSCSLAGLKSCGPYL